MLTEDGAEKLNNLEEDEGLWEEGDVIEVEPTTQKLASFYGEDFYGDDESYCIHNTPAMTLPTNLGWSQLFIEDENKFKPLRVKITNWKRELE